jgi:PAS domain S-box-containing protein
VDDRDARLRQYAALFDASPELLATLDGRGHLDQFNPSWARILGWTAEELRARPLADLVHPEDAAGLRAMLDARAPGGTRMRRQPCACARGTAPTGSSPPP